MKKTSILNVGAAALAILPFTSIISCANAGGVSAKVKDDAFYENLSVDPIVKEESFNNIINRIQKSSALKSSITQEEFEKGMKTVFKEELVLDPTSQIYKELEDANKLSDFKETYIDKAYEALIQEVKSENLDVTNKSRHLVGLFRSHTWKFIGAMLMVSALELLVVFDTVFQFSQGILAAVKERNLMPLLEAFATYDGVLPPTRWIIKKALEFIFDWKKRNNCPSIFKVWGIEVW